VVHLYFEFHGQSEDNERGVASGHNDPDLTPLGVDQALELVERYAGIAIDVVYCSDLLRARRTAEIGFGERGVPIVEDARLRECDYGELNGAPVSQVHAHRATYATTPFPAGQSYADATGRVAPLLAEIKASRDNTTVVIVGHSATYFALEHLLKGRDLVTILAEPWVRMPVWRWELDY